MTHIGHKMPSGCSSEEELRDSRLIGGGDAQLLCESDPAMTTRTTGEALRTCRDCGLQAFTEADLEGFQKGSGRKHGRQNLCAPCNSTRAGRWNAENVNRKREYDLGYRSGAFRDRLVWDVRELSYPSIHQRLRAHFGRASEYTCVHCNGPAREWAYTNDDEDCRYGDSGHGSTVAYSLKPEHYQPMCSGCHRAFDANHRDSHKPA